MIPIKTLFFHEKPCKSHKKKIDGLGPWVSVEYLKLDNSLRLNWVISADTRNKFCVLLLWVYGLYKANGLEKYSYSNLKRNGTTQ